MIRIGLKGSAGAAILVCLLAFTPGLGLAGLEDIPGEFRSAYGGVELSLNSLQMNYSFDPVSRDRYPPAIRLSMSGRIPEDMAAPLYNGVGKITRIVFDNGWEPTDEEISAGSEKIRLQKMRHSNFHVSLSLPMPPREVMKIKILEGVVVLYSREPERRAGFLPMMDTTVAKSVDAGALRLKLVNYYMRRGEAKTFVVNGEIIGKTDLHWHRYYEWELRLKDGTKYERTGGMSSGTRGDTQVQFNVSFPCPENFNEIEGLSASWYDETSGDKIEIPFEFRDIALP